MDQNECTICRRFYSSNEEHNCPAKEKNSESSILEEEAIEKINFRKSTSDVKDECLSKCAQASSTKKREHASFYRSRPNILLKRRKYFDTSAQNVDLISSSKGPSNTSQSSLSGLTSDCPDRMTRISEASSQYIEVGQDRSVSSDTNTVDAAKPPEVSSNSAQEPSQHVIVVQDQSYSYDTKTVDSALDLSQYIDVGLDNSVSFDTNTVDANSPPEVSSRSAFVCYCCSTCGRLYPTRKKLQNHIGVHNGDKKFPCRECGRGFTKRQYYDLHFQCNVGQDPSICKGCGISFTFKCAFKSHFCPKYGNKTIPCDLCNKTFASEGAAFYHKRNHHQ